MVIPVARVATSPSGLIFYLDGMVAVISAAIFYGVASVMEQIGARQERAATSLNPWFFKNLLARPAYFLGLVTGTLGWLLSLLALRILPLFLVQAVLASSIAIATVIARYYYHTRLPRRIKWAVAGVIVGLSLLTLAAGPQSVQPTGAGLRVVLVLVPVALALIASILVRRKSSPAAPIALCGGLAFSGAAICARVLIVPHHPIAVLISPVLWAMIVYSGIGTLLFAIALQRGSVATVNAFSHTSEVLVPTIVGLTLLSDHARPGLWPLIVVGGALVLASAITLSRSHPPSNAPSLHWVGR